MRSKTFTKKYTGIFTIVFFVIALLQGHTGYAQTYINTYAGSNSGVYGDNGPATDAELSSPWGVCFDAAGNLYIADFGTSSIRQVSPSGTITTIAGGVNWTGGYSGDGGAATAALLNGPVGVAIDVSGNLYIADAYNNCIRMVNTSGVITTVVGDGTGIAGYSGDNGPATAAELNTPISIAIDAAGNMYIADAYNYVVRKVDASGTITTFAGDPAAAYPSGDNGPAIAAGLYLPTGVAVDNTGNVYITDQGASNVRKVDASTNIITTVAGSPAGIAGYTGDGGPATAATLDGPSTSVLDALGNLYIVDGTSVIRKVDLLGNINTVVGDGVAGFSGDGGPALAAQLYGPEDVALDASGNMYIADEYNARIRNTYTPPPCNSTPVAGTFSVPITSGCGPYTSFLTVDTPIVNPGITYQWQSSPDGAIWTNISGANSDTNTVTITSTTYYRFYVTCMGTNTSDTSAAQQLLSGAAPGAGIFNATVTSGCSSETPYASVLNVVPALGYSSTGLTYQWQSSPDSISWTNIAGATDTGYIASVPANTYYRFYETCTSGNASDTSGGRLFMVVPENIHYAALPYFQGFEDWSGACYGLDRPDSSWYNRPAFGSNSWRRNDQGTSAGWSSILYYSSPASTEGSYSARFHASQTDSTGNLDLYVDMSGVGSKTLTFDFFDPNDPNYNGESNNGITVLLSTDNGATFNQVGSFNNTNNTWMRELVPLNSTSAQSVIRFQALGYISGFDMGIDSVNVTLLAPCNGTPVAGTCSASITSGCGSYTSFLTADTPLANPGIAYQWQSSVDGATWVNSLGANNTSYTVNVASTAYYRFYVTCLNTNTSDTSTVQELLSGAAPVAGTLSASVTVGCNSSSPYTSILTVAPQASNYSPAGLAYQWQSSPDSLSWTNISGAASTSYTASVAATTYYRFYETCTSGNVSDTSAGQKLNMGQENIYYVTLPYSQGFENWSGACYGFDRPDSNWSNNPATGNNSWRRDDQGVNASWTSPLSGIFTGAPISSEGLHAALFNSSETSLTGNLDLYLDLSAPGAKQITFDYLDPSGLGTLKAYLSTDNGSTFSQLGGPYLSDTWTQAVYVTQSTSSQAILRFQGTGGSGGADFSIDNVNISIATACTGIPATGTAIVSADTACPNSYDTLTLMGYSIANGLTFQWQSSPDNVTWSNVAGATNPVYIFTGQVSTTYYRCSVTCTNSNNTANSNDVQVSEVPCSYCIPVTGLGCSLDDYYNYFVTTGGNINFNDSTHCLGNGYAFLNTDTVAAVPGTTVNFTFQNNPYHNDAYEIWVDWNQDYEFEPNENVYNGIVNEGQVVTATITIPASAVPGLTRMRVSMGRNFGDVPVPFPDEPCGNTDDIYYGITKDYDFVVGGPCSGIPAVGTIVNNAANFFCLAGSDTLTLTEMPFATGLSYQWQFSTDGNTWTNTGNNAIADTTGTLTTTTYYRNVVTCTLSGNTATTQVDTVTISSLHAAVLNVSVFPGDTICSAGSPVAFTAIETGGGANPAYQWTENGTPVPGASSSTYSSNTVDNGDMVICTITADTTCSAAVSDTTIITVGSAVAPVATITSSPAGIVSAGQAITFTATVTNGGNNPAYQWQKNGIDIPGATVNPYISSNLANNNFISCLVTSDAPCASPATVISDSIVVQISSGVPVITNGGNNIRLYPSPNNGSFYVAGTINDGKQARIEVLDIIGQVVYSTTVPVQNGTISKQVQLQDNNADGIYMLRIKTDNGTDVIRFVMER